MKSQADILEDDLVALGVLDTLLKDHTTRRNILWATDSYANLGDAYKASCEIKSEDITGDDEVGQDDQKIRKGQIVQPRSKKSAEVQSQRVKDKAEVFTPSWICNAQNNLIDSRWFGRKDRPIFNVENDDHSWTPVEGHIDFEGSGHTWEEYVKDLRLEITCGEAPYIVSRYDTVTGDIIDLDKRVGLLDRKMRVIKENVGKDLKKWVKMTKEALKSIYGYEWQGDSLLLARESIFVSILDYYEELFGSRKPHYQTRKSFARIISWNLWQMDGLKMVVPDSCHPELIEPPKIEPGLFDEIDKPQAPPEPQYRECPGCKAGDRTKHNGIQCRIRDWSIKKKPKGWDPNCEQAKLSDDAPWQIITFSSLLQSEK